MPTATRRKSKRRKANLTADQVVADQIKALRERRSGLSQQQLADKINESQSVIARIESGARKVSVADLLKIAWALDVAPGELLAASFAPCDVPIVGNLRLAPAEARAWVVGDRPIPGGDVAAYYGNVSDEEAHSRHEQRQLQARYEALFSLAELAAEGRVQAGDEHARRLTEQVAAGKKARRSNR